MMCRPRLGLGESNFDDLDAEVAHALEHAVQRGLVGKVGPEPRPPAAARDFELKFCRTRRERSRRQLRES